MINTGLTKTQKEKDKESLSNGKDYSLILGNYILECLYEEFLNKHQSLNLLNTTQKSTMYMPRSSICNITIKAPKYDTAEFIRTGAITYVGGSYAQKLDKEGSSFYKYKVQHSPSEPKKNWRKVIVAPKNHQNYVSKIVYSAIFKLTQLVGNQNIEVS
jgi:hypothetical protein